MTMMTSLIVLTITNFVVLVIFTVSWSVNSKFNLLTKVVLITLTTIVGIELHDLLIKR